MLNKKNFLSTCLIVLVISSVKCDEEYFLNGNSQGTIKYPSEVGQYQSNKNVIWNIDIGDTDVKIGFKFNWLSMEACPDCSCDYVEIIDNNDKTIAKVCVQNERTSEVFIAQGSQAKVKFVSDKNVVSTGFQLDYWTVRETTTVETPDNEHFENLTQFSGTVHYPQSGGQYPNFAKASWFIDHSQFGFPMEISFFDVDIQDCKECGCDSVRVYDGPDAFSPILGTFCGQHNSTGPFRTTSHYGFILFLADGSITGNGFSFTYKNLMSPTAQPPTFAETTLPPTTTPGRATTVECSKPGSILTEASGTLQFFQNGSYYPNDYQESWLIDHSRFGSSMRLSFQVYDIEGCSSCSCDSLTIYNGPCDTSPIETTICGLAYNTAPIILSSPLVYLKFTSDLSSQRQGFIMDYATLGGDIGTTVEPINVHYINTFSGTVRYPFTGNTYASHENVGWLIDHTSFGGYIT